MWENLYNTLNEYGEAVRNKYQDNLIDNDSIATGGLLNSVEFKIDSNDRSIILSLDLESYWKYVENGSRPHWPPVDKIKEWIKVKPVIPDNRGKRLPTPNQLAYLIGRKIAKEGTEPTYALKDALADLKPIYEQKIIEAATKDINNDIERIITFLV